MFSSPEKSPVRENGAGDYGNESAMSSDGMSMDEGTLISSKHRLCLTLNRNSQAMVPAQWTFSTASMADGHPSFRRPLPPFLDPPQRLASRGHLGELPVCDLQARSTVRLPRLHPQTGAWEAGGQGQGRIRRLSLAAP